MWTCQPKSIPQLLGYQDSFKNIETHQLRGEDAELQGISYQIVTSEHMLEMQNLLRSSLGKEPVTELETNAVLPKQLFGRTAPSTSTNPSKRRSREQEKNQIVGNFLRFFKNSNR